VAENNEIEPEEEQEEAGSSDEILLFENERCHISFNYPGNWYKDVYNDGTICAEFALTKDIPETDTGNLPLYFTVENFDSQEGTPSEYYEDLKKNVSVSVETSSLEIDGKDMFFVRFVDEYDYVSYHIFYEVDSSYYSVNWMGKDVDKNQNEIKGVLDSIKVK